MQQRGPAQGRQGRETPRVSLANGRPAAARGSFTRPWRKQLRIRCCTNPCGRARRPSAVNHARGRFQRSSLCLVNCHVCIHWPGASGTGCGSVAGLDQPAFQRDVSTGFHLGSLLSCGNQSNFWLVHVFSLMVSAVLLPAPLPRCQPRLAQPQARRLRALGLFLNEAVLLPP